MRYEKSFILAGLVLGLISSSAEAEMSRRTHLVAQTAQQPKVEADRLLQQGIQQTQSDQFETAIQSLQQALQLYQELKDLQAEATTLMSLGNAHEALARYDPAMAYYDQARQIYQKLNDLNGVSDALMALGTTSESLSQYEKAIKYHEQSLALARKVKNRFNEGRSLGNLGTAYLGLGDYETTIKYHKQSLAIKQETNDRLGEGRILSDMGTAYLALGDTQTAISLYHDSLRIAWEVDDRRGEAIALRNLGKAYEALGRYDKAVESHKESLAIAQEIGDRRGEGESLINLGVAYRGRGNYAQAIEYHEQSLAITREIGDRRGEGSALGNLGMNYYAQGNYTKAIEYHTQRLAIALEIKDRQGEGNAMGNLGNAYRNQGNYAKAIKYHEKRLAITREIKEIRGEGQSLGYLGLVYRTLGNYEKSIEYYQQSLEISIKIKDRLTEAKSLGYLGNAYYDLGYYTEAIKYHQMSLEVAKAINDRRGQGKSLGYLGNAYDAQGQYDEAIKYYTLSLEIAREVNDRRGEGKTLSSLGSAYHELGDYDKAIEYHKSGLEIARKINNRDGERIALSNLGLTLQKQNQPDLSIVFYKQSVNVSESLRQEIKKLPRQVQEIYTSSVAGTYRNLADLLLSQGRIREAQSILELLKVQEVQSYGDEILDSAAIQLPFHPLEANALKGFEAVLSANTFSPITLAGIGQPLRQNRDRILQDSNNTSTQIGNPEPIFKANPNALLIQNLVVGDKLWVLWTAANGKTTAVEVPNVTQARLTLTVQKFRDQIGSPFSDLDVLKDTSNQIYNWLLPAQLQAELAKNPRQALIFSLDHVTRYVPIAALFDGNQYLTQRYTVSNLITTDSDMGDRLSQNGQMPTVLALGTSKAFPNFTPLPNVPAELNAIVQEGDNQGIYPGKIRLDEAFTANILRANLDAYRILHIATHGSFNPKSITDSFLLLGDGNRLPITEISRLTQLTTTHLVVLSACETGLSGSAQDGTEISGISGYFLYRGAKSVLASLWAVNDASTSLLMQQFYRNLATNTAQHPITKAEALRQAQLALLQGKITAKDAPNRSDIAIDVKPGTRLAQERSDFSHPYYWAPFVLIGNSL